MLKLKGMSFMERKTGDEEVGLTLRKKQLHLVTVVDCDIRLLTDASDSSMVIAWYSFTVTQYSGGSGRVQSGS